jgi:hypothetical protein
VKKQRLCTEGETCEVQKTESEKKFSDWMLELIDGRSGAIVKFGANLFFSHARPHKTTLC